MQKVNISLSKGFAVTARKCEAESVEYNQDRSLDITVYLITGLVQRVFPISGRTPFILQLRLPAALHVILIRTLRWTCGENELATHFPDLDLYHPWNITVDEAIELAVSCEKLAFAKDSRIQNSEGTTVANVGLLSRVCQFTRIPSCNARDTSSDQLCPDCGAGRGDAAGLSLYFVM